MITGLNLLLCNWIYGKRMLATNSLIELESIIDDINGIINSVMNLLDQVHKKEDSTNKLADAQNLVKQLNGIFTMLGMPGALALVDETDIILARLESLKCDKKQTVIYTAISDAFAILVRYIEYISQRSTPLPNLLLPTINRLRQINNKGPFAESKYFILPANIQNLQMTLITSDTSDFGGSVLDLNLTKIRHLRKMFQVGLIEVIRRSNLLGGLRMMRRSLQRVHADFSGHSLPDMWIIANCMIEAYLTGGLTINNQRIKILSLVDRQYRLIEISEAEKSQAESNRVLLGEMLFLVSLSESQDKYTLNLKKKYELFSARVDDSNFKHELSVLSGPVPKDLQSLSNEILEELIRVEILLNVISEKGLDELKDLLSMVETLSSLFRIVQLEDESLRLALITSILKKAVLHEESVSQSDLNISREVIRILKSAIENNQLSKLSTTKVGRKQLTAEQQAACQVSNKHIKKAMQQFDYCFREIKQSSDSLSQVVEELELVKNALKALKLNKLIDITDDCIRFVQAFISGKYNGVNRDEAVQFLADAIGGIEFYMETISKNRTPGPSVLQFAQGSIKELKLLGV